MIQKLKDLFKYMNERGIAVPMARDHDVPSVSLTLLILSSIFTMLALLSLTIPYLQINFWESLAWHITSAVLYYNRGATIGKNGFEIKASSSEVPEIKPINEPKE